MGLNTNRVQADLHSIYATDATYAHVYTVSTAADATHTLRTTSTPRTIITPQNRYNGVQ